MLSSVDEDGSGRYVARKPGGWEAPALVLRDQGLGGVGTSCPAAVPKPKECSRADALGLATARVATTQQFGPVAVLSHSATAVLSDAVRVSVCVCTASILASS